MFHRAPTSDTLVARYNDLDSVSALLSEDQVAAVIVEPVAGNMGCVLPVPGFLSGCAGSVTLMGPC